MAINFPNTPTVDDVYTYESTSYRWTGKRWIVVIGKPIYTNTNYSSVSGDTIYADTTGGALTITLPTLPIAFSEVNIVDAENYFYVNNVTVDRNGETIEGVGGDWTLDKSGAFSFVFYDNTWNIFEYDKVPYQSALAPTIAGPTTEYELKTILLTITNYNPINTYSVTPSDGSFTRNGDIIYWTLPSVTANTAHNITVEATYLGDSQSTSYDVTVLNVDVVGDSAVIITDFTGNDISFGWS